MIGFGAHDNNAHFRVGKRTSYHIAIVLNNTNGVPVISGSIEKEGAKRTTNGALKIKVKREVGMERS